MDDFQTCGWKNLMKDDRPRCDVPARLWTIGQDGQVEGWCDRHAAFFNGIPFHRESKLDSRYRVLSTVEEALVASVLGS